MWFANSQFSTYSLYHYENSHALNIETSTCRHYFFASHLAYMLQKLTICMVIHMQTWELSTWKCILVYLGCSSQLHAVRNLLIGSLSNNPTHRIPTERVSICCFIHIQSWVCD